MQKAIRIIAIVAVVGLLLSLIIYNATKPVDYTPWNEAMTLGNKETAKHHFIMYTDIFCPYCDKFSDAVQANMEDFSKRYIEDENVYFEIRMTDMNYKSGHSNNSKPGGEAAYCAADQGKFWEFYHEALSTLYEDFHSKGVGVDKTSPKIRDLENEYFYGIAERSGVEINRFKTCFDNHEMEHTLDVNTNRASSILSGVPYFVFDKFKTSGFAGNWNTTSDYEQVKLLMDAGLTSKK